MRRHYFTSESVSSGHPDKICDQISDAILDEFMLQDFNAKVACECFITNNLLVIGGEAHSTATVDIIGTAKRVLEKIGYDGTNGFNPETAVFVNTLHEQSPDIRQGVERPEEEQQGAGDQGIMFGYATNETDVLMPLPIMLANLTMEEYDRLRKETLYMMPDAKCQYTVLYEDEKPIKIDTIVLSMQHKEEADRKYIEMFADSLLKFVFERNPEYAKYYDNPKILINPTGRFVIGGPEGDTGLTGRKIVVDTYGGMCPHGGGAFSGKDPSKVDRSAAYYARYIAKNLVFAGVADSITVQLSYGIGIAEPISVHVYGNLYYPEDVICRLIREVFNPTPYNIIKSLHLKEFPRYAPTATYGHFGNVYYPWEELDKHNEIKNWLIKNVIVTAKYDEEIKVF